MMTDMRFGRVSIMGIIGLLWMIAISVLWVRSFYKTDSWIWIRPMRGGVVATHDGYLNIARFQITDPSHATGLSGACYCDAPGELPIDNGLPWNVFAAMGSDGDLSQFSTSIDSTYRCSLVWVPLSAFELMGLPFVVRWGWMVVCVGLRKKRGQCMQCGYDLRETPNRCPECGTEVRSSGRMTKWLKICRQRIGILKRLKKALPLLSMLVALGVIALGILSFQIEEGIAWTDWNTAISISVYRGSFYASTYSDIVLADSWTPAGFIFSPRSLSRIRENASAMRLFKAVGKPDLSVATGNYAGRSMLQEYPPEAQHVTMPPISRTLWRPVEFSVPVWPLVLMLMLLPTRWLVLRAKARKLSRVGLCRRCSYDLRETSGRCPECGMEVAQSS